jgi:hypothetical protein
LFSSILKAKELVLGGDTVKSVSLKLGVNYTTLLSRFKKIGFNFPKNQIAPNKIDLSFDEIFREYERGESVNTVSKIFGVSRNVINRILVENGITPRTQSEAETLKWSKMSKEVRAKQVEKAHEACRGRIRSENELTTSALARERNPNIKHIGHGEIETVNLLNNLGVDFVYQKAIGRYNVDFAIGDVAVELTVCTGRYNSRNSTFNKRVKYLRRYSR